MIVGSAAILSSSYCQASVTFREIGSSEILMAIVENRYKMLYETGLNPLSELYHLTPDRLEVKKEQHQPVRREMPYVSFNGENINIDAKAVPLPTLLDNIAKACSLRIFSPSAVVSDEIIDIVMDDSSLEDVLDTLLTDHNYLIIYNERPQNLGLSTIVGTLSDYAQLQAADLLARSDGPEGKEQRLAQKANYFRQQMEMLQQRIDSGASDKAYQDALESKSPEYVTHDEELLASFKKRLAELEGR